MIGIVDYGMGNLGSVTNACRFLNLPCTVVTAPSEVSGCRALILPGVGAFGDCMKHIRSHDLEPVIQDWIAADRPFLGICVGLQVLFAGSEESPGVPGLGIFSGMVHKFPGGDGLKIPQIGWNRVTWKKTGHPVMEGIPDGSHFYFVHSYYVDCADSAWVAATTEFGITYTCAVTRGNLFAVQFHPEKSQKVGLALLQNFATRAAGSEVRV
ncbi:MAG: imidazole glycerol phosphate synthase subunit HisH [Verrucomicrobia bacterium]|nr:imidazole glycerol phosphate synthase subunit HisH [Verrucomicrobiota bacterium]